MANPRAVLISDVHYNLQTLPLADAAMRQAIQKANELQVPLIVAGDLHDTKANLRGECINAMLETFNTCEQDIYFLIGNHDLQYIFSYESNGCSGFRPTCYHTLHHVFQPDIKLFQPAYQEGKYLFTLFNALQISNGSCIS